MFQDSTALHGIIQIESSFDMKKQCSAHRQWNISEGPSLTGTNTFSHLTARRKYVDPEPKSGPEVKKNSCSTELSTNFFLLINVKMPNN